MKSIAIKRLRVIPMPKGTGVTGRFAFVMAAELAKLGYRVSNPELLEEGADSLFLDHASLIDTLVEMRGGDVQHVPLFKDFPGSFSNEDVIEHGTPYVHGLGSEWHTEWKRVLSSIPQTKQIFEEGKVDQENRKSDAHTEWIDMKLVPAEDALSLLRDWMYNTLYAQSSIKQEWHDDLRALLKHFGTEGIDFERVVMKENRAFLLEFFWKEDLYQAVIGLTSSPTDLLRLFASLTGTDISLGNKIKFPKFSRKQRRAVLGALELCPNLEEDLVRYRGLWLNVARYIHPGSYAKKMPKVARAFKALAENKITTFNGLTDKLVADNSINALMDHLQHRPGVFARKLHELLRKFPGSFTDIVRAFGVVVDAIPTKTLLVLEAYFLSINEEECRTIINKRGSIKVLPNTSRNTMSEKHIQQVVELIQTTLVGRFSKQDSFDGSVWIDPKLRKTMVPLQQRMGSDGILTVGRGSRIPLHIDRVLRLFVYWKQTAQRTDLDLSVAAYDENFKQIGQVSWTRLGANGMHHSGDLTSAEHGAAEFIDIELDKLNKNVRYISAQILRFSGEAFSEMTCFAGWMIRDKVDTDYKSFDIKTVANKFDLQGNKSWCIPLLVDLLNNEIIYTDLYVGQRSHANTVEGNISETQQICRELSRFVNTRPNLHALVEKHVRARKANMVNNRDEADITIGLEGSTYDLSKAEEVLANWL